MQCDDAINLICAEIDGELPADGRSELDIHLAQCADCRAVGEAMRLQDAQLVRAFAPRRKVTAAIADRVNARLTTARTRRTHWLIPLAAAAGFLLAVMMFHPSARTPSAPGQENSVGIGHLDIATGLVECRAAGGPWRPMLTGATVVSGLQIRTGPGVHCELAMDDGSEVRLNENSELQLTSPRKLDLAAGQVFSVVAKERSPFELGVAGATVTALATRFDVQRRADQVILAVLDGSTKFAGTGAEQVVRQGQVVSLANGHFTQIQGPEALDQATRWITDILMLKGRDNSELNTRIDDLFAQIGESKMAYLRENELRALGDRCVIPLAHYLDSPRSTGHTFKRQEAARIIADVAQPWDVPDLIKLLQDTDGQVRASAAKALFRLTSETQDRSVEQWRDQPPDDGRAAFKAWQLWWRENHDRYPTSDRLTGDPFPVTRPATQTQHT